MAESAERSPRWSALWMAAPGIAFVLGWHILVVVQPALAFYLGSPLGVLGSLRDGIVTGWIIRDLGVTGSEVILGYLVGNSVGFVAAATLWWLPALERSLRPYVAALGAAPLFAAAPLLVLWFGTGFQAKVVVAALSTVFVAMAQAAAGLRSVREDHLRLMKTFGATRGQVFRFVTLPSSGTWASAALKLNIGFAILGAFLAEFISAEAGLGKRILVATGLFDMSQVLASLLILMVLAGALQRLVRAIDPHFQRMLQR